MSVAGAELRTVSAGQREARAVGPVERPVIPYYGAVWSF